MTSYWALCESVVKSFNITNYSRIRDSSEAESLVFACKNSGFQTRFRIKIHSGHKRVTITSYPVWNMPESKRAQGLLYVTLLNYKLPVGSVEIDLSNGEVRFKTSAPFGNASNIRPVVETLLGIHVDEGKPYLEGFAAIKDDNADAEDAMRVAEMSGSGGGSRAGGGDAAADLLLQLLVAQNNGGGSNNGFGN